MPLIQRYTTTDQGAMVLTGNTLVIMQNVSYPGSADYNTGAYITTNSSSVATAGFPNGTTLLNAQSSSSAILNMPANSTVLFAQLYWLTLAFFPTPDANITFTTPGGSNTISPNLALKQTLSNVVWQARDVTAIVNAAGPGTYTVGNVPGLDIVNPGGPSYPNAWYLMVVYRNTTLPYRYFDINTGIVDVRNGFPSDFNFTGFITPTSGNVTGYLIVSQSYGDLADGAEIFVGANQAASTSIGNPSTGVWNNQPPYAQKSNMLPSMILNGDTNDPNISLLDTRGTLGTYNKNPFAGTAQPFSRNNADLMGINISSQLTINQNTLFTRIFYGGSGSGSVTNHSVQVDLNSANLGNIRKSVDRGYASYGTTLTYTIGMSNTGLANANNVVVIDTIPSSSTFVNGSVQINGVTSLTANPQTGINLGTMVSNQAATITFIVTATPVLPYPSTINNLSEVQYNFTPGIGLPAVSALADSNVVVTTINIADISTSKTVSKTSAFPSDILTYTIPLNNVGTTVAKNIVLIDTIASNVTFVPNSLIQDGVVIPGSPTPPVFNLNNIPGNTLSTVSFRVTINSIPISNSIPNSATINYLYTSDPSLGINVNASTITNTVLTTINYSNLSNIVKFVDRLYSDVNTTINYTVSFSNTGFTTATNVFLIDTVPTGTNFVTGSVRIDGVSSVTANPAPPGINVGIVGPSVRTTVTFSVFTSATPPYQNSFVNTSQVTYNVATSITSALSNSVTTTLSTALIRTSKSVDKSSAIIGDVLTYTVPITNLGTTIARSVVFIDTVPSGTTLVPNSLRQDGAIIAGNPNPPGVVLNNISPNITSTVTFQVNVNTLPSSGLIANSANISYSYTVDPVTAPIIQVSTATNTNTVTSSASSADLSGITKTVSRNYTDVNTTITYTVSFTNTGNSTANNVVFMDTIPLGTSFIPGSVNINGVNNPLANPALPGINLNFIGPNTRTTVSFNVLVSSTVPYPTSLPNNAQITYNYSSSGSTVFTQATSNTVLTTLSTALIRTSKSVNKPAAVVGDVLTYTIPITNLGTTIARSITFLDTVPSGTTFVPNSLTQDGAIIPGTPNPPGAPLNNISPGATSTVSFQTTVTTLPSSGSITNSANISYTYTVDPATTPVIVVTTATNTNTATSSVNSADLSSITKLVSRNYTDVNTTITYTVAFSNLGNITANNVIFMDTIPSGSTFVTGSVNINGVNNVTANPALPGIDLGSIGANIRTTITFNVIAAPTAPYPSSLTNNAQITYNYTASGGGGTVFTQATSNFAVTTISGAIISTSKRVNKTFATIGDVFNYTLPLTNSGTTIARNVIFVDTLASGLTFVTNSIRQDGAVIPGNPASPGVTLNNIAPNTTSTVSFQATVTSIPSSGVVINTGSFSYTYTVDPATTPIIQVTTTTNTNAVPTTISTAILSPMSKSASVSYAKCGDIVTFTITLPNTGNATAINVIFTDTIPPGTTLVANSVTVNGISQPGATPASINLGSIGPGSSSVVTFRVTVSC